MSRSKGKGSTSRRMLCQPYVNPSRTIYRGSECERSNAKDVAPPPFLFGAEARPQKCYYRCAPKGVMYDSQQCHHNRTPTSFGARTQMQQCQKCPAPRGRAKIFLQKCHVTNALPNQLQGFNAQSQKCHNAHNPRKGAI